MTLSSSQRDSQNQRGANRSSAPGKQKEAQAGGSATQNAAAGQRQSETGRYRGRNLFLDLPIAGRLALGFAIAALVAGLAAGVVGLERSQSLSKQTDFYHHLLQLNTSLTTGRSFLELMNSKLHQTVDDASAPNPSRETLAGDDSALNNLTLLYAQTLTSYVQQDLLDEHTDQMALLNEANEDGLAQQQLTLTSSTQRTWQYYRDAQQAVMGDLPVTGITPTDLKNAQLTLQQQAEPTNADALSSMDSLLQLDDRLASAVDDATNVEIHNELITTLLAAIGAFFLISIVGWFISDTLVRRLRHLQRVTRAVEEGRINERVQVTGRDEIAEVSLAVNAMIDTILGLLQETREQRDALTGAAEHLFSDMRIVNAGDLRVNAAVSDDPIGMLANAFNFTVGRFRRFVLRTQTTVEQLDIVSRQSLERSSAFILLVRGQLRDLSASKNPSQPLSTGSLKRSSDTSSRSNTPKTTVQPGTPEATQAQETLFQGTRDDLDTRLGASREIIERAGRSLGRLSELISSTRSSRSISNATEKVVQAQLQELVTLEQLLRRLNREVRQVQLNATNNLAKLEAALVEHARSVTEQAEQIAVEGTISEAQYEEFIRQAGSFAVEINSLSKRLSVILQEMRSGTVPFHTEGNTNPGEAGNVATRQLDPEPAGSTGW